MTQNSFRKSLTRFTRPTRVNNKSKDFFPQITELQCRPWVGIWPAPEKEQKQSELPGRDLDQLRHQERALSNLLSCGCAVFKFLALWAVTHAWVGLGDAVLWVVSVALSSFSPIFLSISPMKLIGSSHWTSVVSIFWSVMVLHLGWIDVYFVSPGVRSQLLSQHHASSCHAPCYDVHEWTLWNYKKVPN